MYAKLTLICYYLRALFVLMARRDLNPGCPGAHSASFGQLLLITNTLIINSLICTTLPVFNYECWCLFMNLNRFKSIIMGRGNVGHLFQQHIHRLFLFSQEDEPNWYDLQTRVEIDYKPSNLSENIMSCG